MEMNMKTLTKLILGAAMLAGSAVAAAAPASAQPGYGDGVYGRNYDGRGYDRYEFDDRYGERYYRGGGMWRATRLSTSPRFGSWRFDPRLGRRIFVPYRWAVRSGALRDCMYTMNRYGMNRYGGSVYR
jgi:hypothetical protein